MANPTLTPSTGGTEAQPHYAVTDQTSGSVTVQDVAQKGTANGYASLDGAGLVPGAQLPASVASLNALTGAVTLAAGSNVTLSVAGQTITIAASGGGGGGLTPLFDQTLAAAAAAIDTGAGGIAGTASHLRVVALVRTTQAVVASTVLLTLNNDTGNNYDRVRTETINATVNGATTVAAANVAVSCAGASVGNASLFTPIIFEIPCYVQTAAHKSGVFSSGIPDSTAANARADNGSFLWRNTAAISRLALTAGSGNLAAGSRVTVYGM
jgi:hypothetical protein